MGLKTISRRVLVVFVASAGWIALQGENAYAACHAFEISVEPATVAEGAAVQVTVSRDAAVGPSQIDVETIDGSARGGADYDAVARRTISFTNETSQTFPVQTKDDAERESGETFRIHLSNPDGCSVNPNFRVGPDVTVTIGANDEPGASTTQGGAATTGGRPGTTAPTPSTAPPGATGDLGSTTAPPTLPTIPGENATGGSSTTRDDQVALSEDEGGGIGTVALLVALGVAAALAGGAAWLAWQRRRVTPFEP